MRASEDRKAGLIGQENPNQLKIRADAGIDTARQMAESNVPGSLNPTGERPGVGQTDKHGVPLSLQGQISPGRVEKIQDTAIRLPAYKVPPMPAATGGAPTPMPPAPPQAAENQITRRSPTEKEKQQLERLGGHENAISKPDPSAAPWVQYIPSFEHSSDYRGLKWQKKLENK